MTGVFALVKYLCLECCRVSVRKRSMYSLVFFMGCLFGGEVPALNAV